MANPVIMPRQGQSVESCIITKWLKVVGEQVNVGDVLFTYETDKASFEEEAAVAGLLLGCFFEEWDEVPCLETVCVIGNEAESFSEFDPRTSDVDEIIGETESTQDEEELENMITEDQEKVVAPKSIQASNSGKVSPRAKNLAIKLGIDVKQANATGPNGRVIVRDILKLKELGIFATSAVLSSGEILNATGTGIGGRMTTSDIAGDSSDEIKVVAASESSSLEIPNAFGYRDEKLPNIRKVISKAMMNSLQSTAQLTLTSSFDASEILALRKKLKASNLEVNVTLNDMIMFAVSRVLKNHPTLNAHFLGDTIRFFDHVHMGLAVDTPRGLLVPTIFNADTKSLVELAKSVKELATLSKEGSINPDLLTGGSFTITNLGTFGIESFTPVLNPPQTGILGINTITQRVKDVDGTLTAYPVMCLSLTFNHGALDGAPAARFLQELGKALENFTIMLMQ